MSSDRQFVPSPPDETECHRWFPHSENLLLRRLVVLEEGISQPSEQSSDERNGKPPNGYSPDKIYLSEEIFRLKKEKQELLDQLQFKDQVLAMLAHDLRSPLTAASIAVETLELAQNQPDSEKSSNLTAQLYKQARTQFRVMNRMITDILQTAKGASSLNLKLQSLSLPELCGDIFRQFTESLTAKSLHLEKDVPQDIPPVYADAELIRQVLTNLIENAIKYTPEQGTLSVSVLHRTTQKVQISVCDTGPGIPEEQREQIFDGHFRLKRDEAKEGYGIGLSLCRQIIQAHYGQIWVDSVPNSGSSFHFTLPVYR
ncbi:MAG: histidine kinase [Kamptonema sp. SIO4C4]|nr:histidine kinase [Kamptonema sp. SIO4C4]